MQVTLSNFYSLISDCGLHLFIIPTQQDKQYDDTSDAGEREAKEMDERVANRLIADRRHIKHPCCGSRKYSQQGYTPQGCVVISDLPPSMHLCLYSKAIWIQNYYVFVCTYTDSELLFCSLGRL